MKFSVQLPTDRVHQPDDFVRGDAIATMARAIEAAGFDACYVTDHPFPPSDFLENGGHHSLDPFVSLSTAAAATKHLQLHLNVVVLSYRNPFVSAKAIASLDAVSGGRVIVGVAAGYLEGEFQALGADFSDRNAVNDDTIEAMKAAWTGDPVERSGPGYEAAGNVMLPRPTRTPHPPIWVGGNSQRAIQRAVEHGDGWSPFPLPPGMETLTRTAAIPDLDALARKIEGAREQADRIGRTRPLDVNFVPFDRGMNSTNPLDSAALLDQIAALEEIGVTWVSVGVPCDDRSRYLESLQQFGEEVIFASSKQGG